MPLPRSYHFHPNICEDTEVVYISRLHGHLLLQSAELLHFMHFMHGTDAHQLSIIYVQAQSLYVCHQPCSNQATQANLDMHEPYRTSGVHSKESWKRCNALSPAVFPTRLCSASPTRSSSGRRCGSPGKGSCFGVAGEAALAAAPRC